MYAVRMMGASVDTQDHPPLFEPDYAKDVHEVYRDFALDWIHRTESLEILCAVQHDPNAKDIDRSIPSWVPYWDHYYNCQM